MTFFFPKPGTFEHGASNICVDRKIIAISEVYTLEVGKKAVVKNVETFRNLMMSIHGLASKKAKILEILKTKDDLITDQKFEFSFDNGVLVLMKSDLRFYIEVMRIVVEKYLHEPRFLWIAYENRRVLLTEDVYKPDREFVFQLIKAYYNHLMLSSDLLRCLNRPVESQFFGLSSEILFDEKHKHLEYFPIVNQRVFSIGGLDDKAASNKKQIMNKEFDKTYKQFVHMLLHQQD